MAPNRGRNRQGEFAEFSKASANDFDPEADDLPQDSDDASDLDDEASEFDGREHYENVGKSKLRKAKEVPLGPQYRGSKVGRDALEEEEEDDDPFGRGFDEEESSADEGVEFDERESDEEGSEDGNEDGLDGTDDTDLSEEEKPITYKPKAVRQQEEKDSAAELKEIMKQNAQKTGSRSLSQANQEEIEKGRAIKKQRTTFDSLLNTRMKLQKSLIATNTLVGTSADQIDSERDDAQQALEAAETAAFSLWQSLNDFREDLLAARTGQKRKRSAFSIGTSTADLWENLQSQEKQSRRERDAVLKKWSAKTQGPSTQTNKGHLNQSAQPASIIEILEQQLSNRLVQKTHAPRSCAPLQASQRVTEDPKIYDDADFYGLLLKELLEQKSQDSVAASNIDLGFQMRREAKTKRNVDTKASKGRKLRYTAHEKLENFMAPEDRTRWGERQADELFGSLFGQRLALAERDEEDGDEEMEEDGVDAEEAGLLMFRS